MGMPEVFYGYNRLYIANPDKDIILEFSPIEALKLSAFENQKHAIKTSSSAAPKDSLASNVQDKLVIDEDAKLNTIDLIPQ